MTNEKSKEENTNSKRSLGNVGKDLFAGLTGAVVSVPDGLASAALAGVNPVYGLYTGIAGSISGSLLTSSQLMVITSTSASALTAGQAIAGYSGAERPKALFLLVILVGVFLCIFSILRLGRLARYVSHAVMTGFLIGVAVRLILDQLESLVGYSPTGSNEATQFVDLIINFGSFNFYATFVGILALVLAFGIERTPLAKISSLFALVIPILFIWLIGWTNIPRVEDTSSIPSGIPFPIFPELSLFSVDLLFSAFALAIIIGVQGVGVSQSAKNPDNSPISSSKDLLAQGAANITCGIFSGIPAGGSVGQTALNISLKARSRLAGIASGGWMLIIVLLIPGMVGRVPMTVLAALMIKAGIQAISLREAKSIWHTSNYARLTILITFIATIILSVPVAVGVGVIVTILFFLSSSASDVRINQLVKREDGKIIEEPPPKTLTSNSITILNVEGSLYFAGARTLFDELPKVGEATNPVVILRLRGYSRAGATLIDVLDEYVNELDTANGRLYLSGVDHNVAQQMKDAGKITNEKDVEVVEETEVLGGATSSASIKAHQWLISQEQDND